MAQNNFFSQHYAVNMAGKLMDLSRPRIMGILNVTPDSFFDGGRYTTRDAILQRVDQMVSEGVDIIDVGAYSSRPGAENIHEEIELDRALQAIQAVRSVFPEARLSIDTFRSSVARAAVQEGAVMINDISGGSLDPQMFETVAKLNVPYIVMHMRGTPQTMTTQSRYENLMLEMMSELHEKLHALRLLGVKDTIIDPGFGFAKTIEQNFTILDELPLFHSLERPLLIGLSRKSMIWRTLGVTAEEALNGTTVLNTIALMKGASILRVHDVKEAVEAVKLIQRLQ